MFYRYSAWAIVRSVGPESFFNTTLHWLSSNDPWAPVLLLVPFPFWWHLCIKFSSIKCTSFYSYINAETRPKWWLESGPETFNLSDLSLFFRAYYLLIWLIKHILSHSCISSVIRFEPSQPTKTFTRLENLPGLKILRCYIVKIFYISEVIGAELKNNQPKKGILWFKSNYYWPNYNICNGTKSR